MATTLRVALAVPDAVNLIHHTITTGGVTAEMMDWYERISPEGRRTLLMVFEKHFWRANSFERELTRVLNPYRIM